MNRWLNLSDPSIPPYIAALFSPTIVSVNLEHGGGACPMTPSELHLPGGDEIIFHYNTETTQYHHIDLYTRQGKKLPNVCTINTFTPCYLLHWFLACIANIIGQRSTSSCLHSQYNWSRSNLSLCSLYCIIPTANQSMTATHAAKIVMSN